MACFSETDSIGWTINKSFEKNEMTNENQMIKFLVGNISKCINISLFPRAQKAINEVFSSNVLFLIW